MERIRTHLVVSDAALERLQGYLEDPAPTRPIASNPSKNQYVFAETIDGRDVIVKLFVHKKTSHRIASFFGVSSADGYCEKARLLSSTGVPVPEAIALLKSGPGPLPARTIYVMSRAKGEMLYPLLPVIEADARRSEIIAEKFARLVQCLKVAGVTHRDLNVKNVLVTSENDLTLIDLDSARAHLFRGRTFRRRHQRDIQTFISTCHGAPRFAAAVTAHITRFL